MTLLNSRKDDDSNESNFFSGKQTKLICQYVKEIKTFLIKIIRLAK